MQAAPREPLVKSLEFVPFKWSHFRSTGYRPHPAGAAIHATAARFIVAVTGRRFGKTKLAAKEAEARLMIPGSRVWVVAPTKTLADRVFREVWDNLIIRLRFPTVRKSQQQKYIQFPWGSEIWGKTAEPGNEDSLVGEGLDFLIVDEASKIARGPRIWEKYLRPTLGDRRGGAMFITTPEGYDYVHELSLRARDPSHPQYDPANYAFFQFASSMNPYLDPGEIEQARATSSGSYFRQEWEASFESHAGLVYKEFDPDIHVVPNPHYPDLDLEPRAILAMLEAERYCGIDFGYTNPFCCLWGWRNDETWVIFDEDFGSGKMHEYWVQRMLERGGSIRERFADPNNAEGRAYFASHGIGTLAANKEVVAGIETVRRLLTVRGDGRPRLLISSRCRNLIRELQKYRYPQDRVEGVSSELPAKAHDNGPDALRYMLHSVESRVPIHAEVLTTKMESFETPMNVTVAHEGGMDWEKIPVPKWEN